MNTTGLGLDLDISWLKDMYKEAEREEDKDNDDDPCVMSSIKTCFIYVKVLDLTVERVVKGSIDLEEEEDDTDGLDSTVSFISQESLYNLVTCHHKLDTRPFKLTDILLYHIPGGHNVDDNNITKITSIYKDLEIPASLPIYHSVNSLIFIFREKPMVTAMAPPLQLSTVLSHILPDEVLDTYKKTRKHRGGHRAMTRKAKRSYS